MEFKNCGANLVCLLDLVLMLEGPSETAVDIYAHSQWIWTRTKEGDLVIRKGKGVVRVLGSAIPKAGTPNGPALLLQEIVDRIRRLRNSSYLQFSLCHVDRYPLPQVTQRRLEEAKGKRTREQSKVCA